MNLEKQVCSLDLSQKLKSLGVKQNSIWSWIHGKLEFGIVQVGTPANVYSAFTVAELGEMLPAKIDEKRLRMWFIKNPKQYCVGYEDLEKIVANTEADARAKMLIYLLEKKLISGESGTV